MSDDSQPPAPALLFDVSERAQVEITGPDRAAFLHNLCTNDIRKLTAGEGCEAMLLDAKGHVLFYVHVFAGDHSLVIETAPGEGERLRAHLDRYHIRENLELVDRSGEWAELLLMGDAAAELLKPLVDAPLPEKPCGHVSTTLAGVEASIRRVEMTRPAGYLISVARERPGEVANALRKAGAQDGAHGQFEAARIEAAFPQIGAEITEKTLPQELARDDRAISFVKGCYIGQETVARIDALGHVNRLLRVLAFNDGPAAAGMELSADGKPQGRVTSAAYSQRLGSHVALAFVARGRHEAGAEFDSPAGKCVVLNTSE